MTTLYNSEVLNERARNLGVRNGISLVLVTLEPVGMPTSARLDIEFHNSNSLMEIEQAVNTHGVPLSNIFSITGGARLLAGNQAGQVTVSDVIGFDGNRLSIRVLPIGDYSTYRLSVRYDDAGGFPLIDPLFDTIDFKFRPGCFNLNCEPDSGNHKPRQIAPDIDYMAKDFDSFKHLLINAMRQRVPNWAPTSEADLDMVILDLLAADADEISDYQDRVMQEAFWSSARKRVSLAKHARLMDYHIHQGNQSATWLALMTVGDPLLPAGFPCWSGEAWDLPDAAIFISESSQHCFEQLSSMSLYTWGGAVTALDAGAVAADLVLPGGVGFATLFEAESFRDYFRRDDIRYLVIEEKLNPETGTINGRDTTRRQLLRLMHGDNVAETVFDPATNSYCVRVRWQVTDALQFRYCFVSSCTDGPVINDITLFHGNIIKLTYGRPHHTRFRDHSMPLAASDNNDLIHFDEAYYENSGYGVTCEFPYTDVAYRNTKSGGLVEPRSTTVVHVSGYAEPWEEQIDLIESKADSEHYIVETDELKVSRIRFGNQENGMALPAGATVDCFYQLGNGSAGNVGADSLTGFLQADYPMITGVHNPFDVTDGQEPEPVSEILRRAPEAYRSQQLRAVTLADYKQRAESLAFVSSAHASYVWSGSWRSVRVSIDPRSTHTLDEFSRRRIESHLNAVRLIGEDLEVRLAQYVPLDIKLTLCIHSDYWPEDLATELTSEFSDTYTRDGRRGFFHPDEWTFSQHLHASQLIGRALSVNGVERALKVSMKRWNAHFGATSSVITISPDEVTDNLIEQIIVQSSEIIRVSNDPDHLEHGRIQFDLRGGRR